RLDEFDEVEIVGECSNGREAVKEIKAKSPDLVFLDIQMPVLNGIDFIKTLKHPPAIILTTAYREYALDGYDLDIIDYLLKPIPFDRFFKAVQRYEDRTQTLPSTTTDATDSSPTYIFLNVNRTHHKVLLDDILYIESLKDYVRFHTRHDRLVVKGNLGSFMPQLPVDRFVRIHRSYAIALAHIQRYNQTEVFIGDQRLPIGVSHRAGFLERLR
ncbi:MAG: LytTR family DNA-binding domain-containing protein, partial [Bacteroidota bacterium]